MRFVLLKYHADFVLFLQSVLRESGHASILMKSRKLLIISDVLTQTLTSRRVDLARLYASKSNVVQFVLVSNPTKNPGKRFSPIVHPG